MEKDEIKQYADDTYGQVSSWINNCDSKASILLALIGVILSIAFLELVKILVARCKKLDAELNASK